MFLFWDYEDSGSGAPFSLIIDISCNENCSGRNYGWRSENGGDHHYCGDLEERLHVSCWWLRGGRDLYSSGII